MNYPPIPPNCPYFSKLCPGVFSLHVADSGTSIEVDCNKPMDCSERFLVAAAAEVAWRKEADQLNILLGEMCDRNIARYQVGHKPKAIESTGDLYVAIDAAKDHITAWRAFGESV